MRNLWLKFGCFLIGYNYQILQNCSEVSAKAVKKYTAAMIIICIIWAFVGFSFTDRYLGAGLTGSLFGGLIMVLIIIQVERQIILAVHKNRWLAFSRVFIAIIMAVIGSLIIDQIVFKEDIEQKKIFMLDQKVETVFPLKAAELKRQITQVDSAILQKEIDLGKLRDDIAKNPTIKSYSSTIVSVPLVTTTTDSSATTTSTTKLETSKSSTTTTVPNPNIILAEGLNRSITDLRRQKETKDSTLLSLRSSLEKEIKERVGFLDELQVMADMLTESDMVLGVWLLWIFFLLALELLVLVSKMLEKDNDYDHMIKHQMNIHIRKIHLLGLAKSD